MFLRKIIQTQFLPTTRKSRILVNVNNGPSFEYTRQLLIAEETTDE